MKTIKILLYALFAGCLFVSCGLDKLDNYPGPNAKIHGGIYDAQTGELIEQDIIRGAQIEYIEKGWDNPETQYMIFKTDGTYRNNLMFSGDYFMKPVRGNFVPVEAKEITVNGDTEINFEVQPYIRIKNATIEQSNERIIASFNLEQTVPNKIVRIGLFAHAEKNVGEPLHTVATQLNMNADADPDRLYRLEIELPHNADKLKKGGTYYFRIGALIDAPEAKFNYAPTKAITIQDYVPPTPGSNPFKLTLPVFVDFGTNISPYPYNNYVRPTDNILSNLIDEEGSNTKFAVQVTKNFSGENTLGVNNTSLGFPATATGDAFWSNGVETPTSELTVSNLNKTENYSFVFYGSRRDAGDNRETKFHVKGKTEGEGFVNTASNSANVAIVKNITPNDDGTIVITISAGPNNNNGSKFYYLNTMLITPVAYEF